MGNSALPVSMIKFPSMWVISSELLKEVSVNRKTRVVGLGHLGTCHSQISIVGAKHRLLDPRGGTTGLDPRAPGLRKQVGNRFERQTQQPQKGSKCYEKKVCIFRQESRAWWCGGLMEDEFFFHQVEPYLGYWGFLCFSKASTHDTSPLSLLSPPLQQASQIFYIPEMSLSAPHCVSVPK